MTYTFKLSRRLAMNGRAFAAALLFGVASLSACGSSSPTGSTDPTPTVTPGWLTVEVTTPNQNDGAIQLHVSGPAIDSVAPISPFDGFGATTASGADVVVTGSIQSGNLVRFRVADVGRASQYQAQVVAAAEGSTYALRSTSGYRAVIVR